MKVVKVIFAAIRWAAALLLLLVLSLNLYAIVQTAVFRNPAPAVFGYRQLVITTGSMEPVIHPGDFIIVRERAAYSVGDIATYRDGNTFVTHRIVSFDGDMVYLQGDSNNTQDEPIRRDQLVGSVVGIIPELGNLTLWLRSTPGMLCILVGSFLLLAAPGWISDALLRRRRRDERSGALPRLGREPDDGEGSL